MYLFKRNGVYHLNYFSEIEGKEKRISTKCRTKPEALKFVSDFKESLKAGKIKKQITFDEFSNDYQKYINESFSASHIEGVKITFNVLSNALPKGIYLKDITLNIIEKIFLVLHKNSRHSAALYLRIIKAAFNKGVQWGYLESNQIEKLKLPKIEKRFPAFITLAELNQIMTCETDKQLQNIYFFAFHTGLRLSEILNLTFESVNIPERIITVKNTDTFTTKSKRERVIPINESLLNTLFNKVKVIQINPEGYLFQKTKGVRLNRDYVSKRFKKAVRKAGLNDKIHFHTLRHSFASNLVNKGCSLMLIKELLGHSDYSTTLIYSHLQKESLQKAVNLLDGQNSLIKAL